MVKLKIKYSDNVVNVLVLDDITSVKKIVDKVVEECKIHGPSPPDFEFDEWESESHPKNIL